MTMKLFESINDSNFLVYAAQNYYNPTCIDIDEFNEDLKRFKYIKRLLTRYHSTDELSCTLILNHLIVIFNVFGIEAGLRMLEFRVFTDKSLPVLKPFLVHLKAIKNDKYTGVTMDQYVVDKLRKI
ncbi:hypothetical protein OAA26_00490 [bacterium]|nr:hypothetical protein [bacterium]